MMDGTMEMAHGISEYGIMIIICAVFLLLSSSLMIACFRWFKSVIENILGDYTDKLERLQEIAERNGVAMVDIAEGLVPETQLRIKCISGVFFDFAAEKVCKMIRKIRKENHWKSHATLTLLAKQDLPTFGYNMIDPLKSWCWGSILFYPFKISRFS